MTLNEYRAQILRRLRKASSAPEAQRIVGEAAETLRRSIISRDSARDFWSSLYEDLAPVIFERQAASSLSSIISAAQAAVAARLAQSKK